MTEIKLGNYFIQTEKLKKALSDAGFKNDSQLKPIDKNSDMKITEDELQEFAADSIDAANSSTSTNSSSGTSSSVATTSANNSASASPTDVSDSAQATQLDSYNQQFDALYERLINASSVMGTSPDMDSYNSAFDSFKDITSQMNQIRYNMYNTLYSPQYTTEPSQIEAAQSATPISSNVDYLNPTAAIKGGSSFANSIVQIAMQYNGRSAAQMKKIITANGGSFHDGFWCADFVTFVVKAASKAKGVSLNGFGSPSVSGLMAWGKSHNAYVALPAVGSSSRAQTIATKVKTGDIMIQKNNASHTGIVAKVYSDGSFDTIEGNTSNMCHTRHYSANSSIVSGFVKMS